MTPDIPRAGLSLMSIADQTSFPNGATLCKEALVACFCGSVVEMVRKNAYNDYLVASIFQEV